MVMEDTEKVELLNAFFASVFTAQTSPHSLPSLKTRKKMEKEDFPLVEEGWLRCYLGKLDTHRSQGPDGMHEGMLM